MTTQTQQTTPVYSENMIKFVDLCKKHFPNVEVLAKVFKESKKNSYLSPEFKALLIEAVQSKIIVLDEEYKAHQCGYNAIFNYALTATNVESGFSYAESVFNQWLNSVEWNIKYSFCGKDEKEDEIEEGAFDNAPKNFLNGLRMATLSEQSTCVCCGQNVFARLNKDLVLTCTEKFAKPCMEMTLVQSTVDFPSGNVFFADWFRDNKNVLHRKQTEIQENSEFGLYSRDSYANRLSEQRAIESLGFFSSVSSSDVSVFCLGDKIIVADGVKKPYPNGDMDYVPPAGWKNAGTIDVNVRRVSAISREKLKEHWVDVPKDEANDAIKGFVHAKVDAGTYKAVNACFNRSFIPETDFPDWFPEGMGNVVCYFEKV